MSIHFQKTFFSIFAGLLIGVVFSFAIYTFAAPPTTPYDPGETLNPTCSPTDTNCTVLPSVTYTGATNNIDLGARNITTTGVGSFGSLSLTTSALTVGNGGTGTGTAFTSGSIVFAGTSGVYNQDNANFFWDNTTNANFLSLGSGTAAGQMRLLEGSGGGTNYTGFKAPATLVGDVTYTLPTADGTSGQLLSTNGTGTLSWATGGGTITGSGTTGQIPYFSSASGITSETNQFTWDATNNRLGIGITAPDTALHLSAATTAIKLTDTASTSDLIITKNAITTI